MPKQAFKAPRFTMLRKDDGFWMIWDRKLVRAVERGYSWSGALLRVAQLNRAEGATVTVK
jgi:hypothetical protein